MEEVEVVNPATIGLTPEQYEVIDTRVQDKLCQEKSDYFVKRYEQPVIKIKESGEVKSPVAIERVIGSSVAEVSVLVGICIDKGLYHLPLYRQHKRMVASGIQLSWATVVSWAGSFIDLLFPIYNSQQLSILDGKVISMADVGPDLAEIPFSII